MFEEGPDGDIEWKYADFLIDRFDLSNYNFSIPILSNNNVIGQFFPDNVDPEELLSRFGGVFNLFGAGINRRPLGLESVNARAAQEEWSVTWSGWSHMGPGITRGPLGLESANARAG